MPPSEPTSETTPLNEKEIAMLAGHIGWTRVRGRADAVPGDIEIAEQAEALLRATSPELLVDGLVMTRTSGNLPRPLQPAVWNRICAKAGLHLTHETAERSDRVA